MDNGQHADERQIFQTFAAVWPVRLIVHFVAGGNFPDVALVASVAFDPRDLSTDLREISCDYVDDSLPPGHDHAGGTNFPADLDLFGTLYSDLVKPSFDRRSSTFQLSARLLKLTRNNLVRFICILTEPRDRIRPAKIQIEISGFERGDCLSAVTARPLGGAQLIDLRR
jgi:hypothetical protein